MDGWVGWVEKFSSWLIPPEIKTMINADNTVNTVLLDEIVHCNESHWKKYLKTVSFKNHWFYVTWLVDLYFMYFVFYTYVPWSSWIDHLHFNIINKPFAFQNILHYHLWSRAWIRIHHPLYKTYPDISPTRLLKDNEYL